ncbi:MAG: PEGA domain-containing protein [Salinivirgaceae bacterium]|nr:PEGA domain-containing protein [Salinivirgaceae bacterium]
MKKKIIIAVPLLLLVAYTYAQNISVESFKKLENDLTARTQHVNDQNGEPCALIKVVVTSDGFMFEGDGLGIVKTERKINEYYVYVPYGAKFLTIKHKDFGNLRQYAYPEKIVKNTTYELKLALSKIVVDGSYLKVSVNPSNAEVYIDGDKIDNDITPFLHSGKHTYKVVLENYTTKTGTIDIGKAKKEDLNVILERSHGYINVNYKPDGAQIYVDGKQADRTPARIKLESGQHSIKVAKDMYVEQSQTIAVTENCNLNLTGYLQKIATGYIHISSNVNYSTVYIDGKYVGSTGQTYEVAVGSHLIKITHSGYNDVVDNVKVKGGEIKYVKKDLTMTRAQKQENRRGIREDRREDRRDNRRVVRDRRFVRRYNRYIDKLDYPSSGFRWFLEAGGGINFSSNLSSYLQSKASTTIGYQIFPMLNLGLGVGVNYYRGMGANDEHNISFDQYMTIPIYLSVRWDFSQDAISLCGDAQLGWGINGEYYYALSAGYRLWHVTFSFGMSYECREYTEYFYSTEFSSYDNLNTWFIKTAIDIGARRH